MWDQIVKMKCDVGRSCADEIRKYPNEPYMPDNQNKFQNNDEWWDITR